VRPNVKRFCLVVLLITGCTAPTQAGVRDELLQKAFNYVFTGTIDPKDAPDVVDLAACAVVVPDPRYPRFIRYYFGRIRPDNSRITKDYAGRQTFYKLEIESDNVVIEYLTADKTGVTQAFRSAQINLPGDIEQTQKALKVIADRCKGDGSKSPFS
jgi:hypothetical protein